MSTLKRLDHSAAIQELFSFLRIGTKQRLVHYSDAHFIWILCFPPGDYKPHIEGGHDSEKAIELLKTFYKGENPNAPEDKRKPARSWRIFSKFVQKLALYT